MKGAQMHELPVSRVRLVQRAAQKMTSGARRVNLAGPGGRACPPAAPALPLGPQSGIIVARRGRARRRVGLPTGFRRPTGGRSAERRST
ncbi:hypothetical protein SL003B_0480 [Polymorphum gilvum SL003B-26A1]|uniref:Uncharacterized protein n=1 Tax=Polymorphum gilvum (strain LMG 25793 / CGMCC 1.9160 / SL003B-26A1) TaxID=991905 RepID=F2J346_POLGS|nr:hypothetical protein SL003B_0480 [Polymorphum gilvum SL003B-26A1]